MQGSSVSFGGFTLMLGCFGIFGCHTVVSIVSVRLFIDARLEACQGDMSGSPRLGKTVRPGIMYQVRKIQGKSGRFYPKVSENLGHFTFSFPRISVVSLLVLLSKYFSWMISESWFVICEKSGKNVREFFLSQRVATLKKVNRRWCFMKL